MRIEIIDKYLEDGYINEAKQGLYEMYSAQDKQEFEANLRAEYDKLFPMFKYKETVIKEYDPYSEPTDDEGYIFVSVDLDTLECQWQKKIDYSEDENYLTFEEYKNETKVVSEAIYEDDILVTPEVTELVRPYIAKDVTDRVEEYINNSEAYKAILKAKKKELLDTITVVVNGKVFDGNETARNNMLASIQASQLLDIESTYWKLADNSVVEVTVDEIQEALALAIQRVGEIVTNG